ncbi:sterol desaturase family protein [Thioalkalicoccus limnaeus]|uniref:Sterol desaturase family protein n=1 Tax=Thioalkalicoccus limnaeus TaxID=120681 RepID=A0ABV4BCP0_9GAMM
MTIDLWIGLLVLMVLFALEGLIPFYAPGPGRLAHAGRNLTLALASGVVGALLAPLVVLATEVARQQGWGLLHSIAWPGPAGLIVGVLLFDLWMYWWHRANHEIRLLWRLHRVHHTDPHMDSTTALRFHPGEILLSTLLNCLVILALGLGLEGLILYQSSMIAVILFHHSNLRLPARIDRLLRLVIVPPSMHRVHHSQIPTETNSNYGTLLSLWDRLFGTFRLREDLAQIRFGIGRYGEPEWQRPRRLLMLPFRE